MNISQVTSYGKLIFTHLTGQLGYIVNYFFLLWLSQHQFRD
jgi:hypothetical protein